MPQQIFLTLVLVLVAFAGCRTVPTSQPPKVSAPSTVHASPYSPASVRGQETTSRPRGYYAQQVAGDTPFDLPAATPPQITPEPQQTLPAPAISDANPWDFVGVPETTPSPIDSSAGAVNGAGLLGDVRPIATHDWSDLAASSSTGVSIEEAQRRDEFARERARLLGLARQSHNKTPGDKPSYVDPLGDWAGPFTQRLQSEPQPTFVASASTDGGVPEYPQLSDLTGEPELFDWEKEEKKSFDWDLLDPAKFFTSLRDWAGMGPDEAKAAAMMAEGREILLDNPNLADAKKSEKAAELFEKAAKKWPDSVLAEEALFLAAECRFFADNYPKAMTNYQSLLIKYHHSKWVNTSVRRLFAIARYWEKASLAGGMPVNLADKSRPWTDTFGNAKKAYEAIFINDPNGPISDDAVMALASAYLSRGLKQGDNAFTQAAYYYAYLRENFPHSKHISKATEMELLARINAYHGGSYDGKSLREADTLAKKTLRERDGDTDLAEIASIKESVTGMQAERDWVMGQYYEKKKSYGASRMYYNKLIAAYPQTTQAGDARRRLEAIAAYPDEPPGYVDRVKNVFTRQ